MSAGGGGQGVRKGQGAGGGGGDGGQFLHPGAPRRLFQSGEQEETLPYRAGREEAGGLSVGGGNQGSLLPTPQTQNPNDCPLQKNSSNLLVLFLINTKDLQ